MKVTVHKNCQKSEVISKVKQKIFDHCAEIVHFNYVPCCGPSSSTCGAEKLQAGQPGKVPAHYNAGVFQSLSTR